MAEAGAHRPGRNEPCHCGSGKKYKHCHLAADEEADRALHAKQAAAAPPPAEAEGAAPHEKPPRPMDQHWRGSAKGFRGSQRINTPRKTG